MLQKQAIKELLDPRLMNCYSEQEVYCMALCAYLCIRRDPNSRPRMSQVCCRSSSEKYFKVDNILSIYVLTYVSGVTDVRRRRCHEPNVEASEGTGLLMEFVDYL